MDIVVIDICDVNKLVAQVGLEEGGIAQKQLDESFIKHCDPYVPFNTGMTQDSAYSSTEIGSGEIIWNTPFSHYLYEGIVYVDPETGKAAFHDEDFGFWSRPGIQKIPSDRELQYKGGGLRGKKWAERMWADCSDEIIAEVEAVIKRGAK